MTAQPDNTSDEQPKEIFFKKDLPTVLDNTQAAQSTIDGEELKQLLDKIIVLIEGDMMRSVVASRVLQLVTKHHHKIAQEANKARLDSLEQA